MRGEEIQACDLTATHLMFAKTSVLLPLFERSSSSIGYTQLCPHIVKQTLLP